MLRSRLLLGAALAAAAACGDATNPAASTAPTLAVSGGAPYEIGVRITPESLQVAAGGIAWLTGSTLLSDGTLRTDSYLMTWTSLNMSVVKMRDGGLVRARVPGRAAVVATRGRFADTIVVTVVDPNAPVDPTVSRVELAATGAVPVGGSATFPVAVYGASGELIPSPVVAWSTSDPAVLSVDASGLATGRAHGYSMLIASSGGKSDTMSVTVGTPGQSSDAVALTLVRFAAGSGTVRASGGIPLAAGRLRPSDLALVRVYVAGREVPIYVEALAGLHPDGSLRSVYVELHAELATSPVAAELHLGTRRLAGDLSRGDPGARGEPAAAVLPSNPDYLVSTGIVGRTLTAAQTTALGGGFATWESNFAPAADRHWSLEGSRWEGNYYDRAHMYFAAWARTGNPEYFRRGAAIAVNYRRGYLEANGYGSSPHWAQLDGLADHYLLTGDEASRVAVGRTAEGLVNGYHRSLGDLANIEGRIQARLLTAMLLAKQLNAGGRSAAEWGTLLDSGVEKVLGTQRADGSFRFAWICYESLNYMSGMLNDALARVHDGHRTDSRIVSSVRRSLDFLWSTQLLTSPTYTFKYVSAACDGVGVPEASPDLNGLMVTAYGWMYRQSGDATYRTRGDQVFAGINAAWIAGSKQFNQSYSQSYNFLGYR